jgi:hypothetical protein
MLSEINAEQIVGITIRRDTGMSLSGVDAFMNEQINVCLWL